MSGITIITNNVPRLIVDTDHGDAIEYKGETYLLDDFSTTYTHFDAQFRKWDGYIAETYFSGILIKINVNGDNDQVIMGRYYT